MKNVFRGLIAAAGAAAIVAAPSAAQAADFKMWSKSGKSYMWHNDGANSIVICDMVSNDGIGAHGIVIGNDPQRDRVVYNGCESIGHIADNWWQDVTICDWVSEYGQRVNKNCEHTQFVA